MLTKQVSDRLRAQVSQVRIAEFQSLQCLVGRFENRAHLGSAVAVYVAVRNVDCLNLRVGLEDGQK